MATRKKALVPPRTHLPLKGSHRELLPKSRGLGAVNAGEIAAITVRTRARSNLADLEKKVHRLYARSLKQRRYLTHDELAALHGARPEDLDAIEAYAQHHNLVITRRSAAQRSITLSGTLGDLLNAFPSKLRMYHHSSGIYRGREGAVHIPAQFEGIITGVFGFDTRPRHKSPKRHLAQRAEAGGGKGVAATEFARRYDFPSSHNGASLDGSGQCIAIIELGGGFDANDLKVFFRKIKVPLPNVVAVSVDGAHNHPTPGGGADGEVLLDIEVAGAVVPKATIAVYFAPNTDKGLMDATNAAIHDAERKPGVVSISWGSSEDPSDAQSNQAYREIFVEAAALGITICAAAGDHGSANMAGGDWDGKIHVDHPSVDPYVLACGGTQIDDAGVDVVWNDGTAFDPKLSGGGGWAGGGGVSVVFAAPPYQSKAGAPKSLVSGKRGRGIPDIAMSANNYFTRVHGVDAPSGGTSAVAPLMAALVALLNQAKGKNVGFLNPFLYANAGKGLFTDVVKGTNAIKGASKGYVAGKGWNACSGLGTPIGRKILAHL